MSFKKFFLIIGIVFFISCKNPYLTDPRFNPSTPELPCLPVTPSEVSWMQPYGYVVYDATRSANHVGFDFGMKNNYAPFYSCGDGVVIEVDYNTEKGLPGTNYRIVIAVSVNVSLDYHFEIGGNVSEEERKRNIFVKSGDYVKAGDMIAKLISLSDGAHVDFGIRKDGKRDICPLEFYTDDAANKLELLFDSVEKRPVRENLCE